MMTFGRLIADARKRANLSLKELSAMIKKEDGEPISPQYLNDIEHDRRNPPADFLLQQFAAVLDIPIEVLYYHTGELPTDLRGISADNERIKEAYRAFRRKLEGNE